MRSILLLLTLCLSGAFFLGAQSSALSGFSEQAAKAQLALEAQFDQKLNASNLDAWMKQMAGRPHPVGSPHGKANAEFMAAQFRSWGYDVQIEEFPVLFPTPKIRLVELINPSTYKALLQEKAVDGDAYTAQTRESLPPYHAFSVDGDVTAELVFVNYGVPADYEELEKRGIDVKGRIVIAKYGGSWRGIKPKVAAEKGAIGCLIYSDPEDDGYAQGDVYPKGAFKHESGVQRGSVLDMPLYPGDPLTPGYGATKDAPRIDRANAPTLTKIPVLPISYQDAQPLLAALSGPVAPASWRGSLPITYHIGPGPARVRLKLEFNWSLQPAYNVIARMNGSEFPDQWIIRGNHHDAWVHGANDPVSGMVSLMEEARAVAELAKAGMRPKRTIIYCAWDAEEPGLLGSTEWAETHADELRRKAVVYINSDSNGRGFLGAQGSHTLEKFFDQVARSVPDPQRGVSVFDRRKALEMVNSREEPKFLKLGALGSGSDYTPFIQHLGIAALNIGFGGESSGGEYHTNFDSYDHYLRFKDPGFAYGIALAKVAGRTTLRMANADVLPFEFTHFSQTVKEYANEVMQLADNMRKQTERENRMIRENLYEIAADPREPFVAPKPKKEVPYFNFAPLQNALARLEQNARKFDGAPRSSKEELASLNSKLQHMESLLTRDHGLPGRPWFRHHIYAPGFYTGYGVKTLPGVREALEQREWEEAQKQIGILADVLNDFCAEMEKMMP